MSTFTYEKIGQYGTEVVTRIVADKGKVKGSDGKFYEIDISKNSTFDKFKQQVEAGKFRILQDWLKSNQFEVLSPQNRSTKFEKLGWTEIEKTVFSSKTIKISTKEQEQITLAIIKAVLGDDTKTWKSFSEMFDDKNSPVKKIFPDLKKLDDWWKNFTLQFNEISKVGRFPNSSYQVYLYDGPGSFMKYITDLVTKEMNLYSQKDSWNPADIYLVKSAKIQKDYIEKFDDIAKELGKGEKSKYADDPFESVREINGIMKKAYDNKDIVGISLKKTDGKTLRYQEFNLQAKFKDQALPDVQFKRIEIDCTYDEKKNQFTSKTSQVFVTDGDRGGYKLGFKSNTGAGIGNITYEFLPDGRAAAFLGKVPKDKLKQWLVEHINRNEKGKLISENLQMPQGTLLDKQWSKELATKYQDKITFIKSKFSSTELKAVQLDNFVSNLADSYLHGGLSGKNASMQQMVEFVYILAKLKDNKNKKGNNLTLFLTLCYYFAQKKGQIFNFGPFAKVY